MDLSFDWSMLLESLVRVVGAFVLALPVGWERERSARSAGLRTFPLVAAASAAYMVVGGALEDASADSQSRIVQGLMTGIGFIGGGAILKTRSRVSGTATAASVWMTGALGAAAGHGQWEIAVLVSLLTTAALHVLTRVERNMTGRPPDVSDGADTSDADDVDESADASGAGR